MNGGVESAPRRISFIVAVVAVVGTVFISARRAGPRKTTAGTDEAIMPISVAGKR